MKLSELTAQYVAHKQSMGMRFRTEQRTLKSFCRVMGDIAMADVEPAPVLAFIAGNGPVTRFWHRKHEVLVGFYRFAISRGYCTGSPLPTLVPKRPPAFVAYIYSREELQRLLEATSLCEHPCCKVRACTFRALILLLYGAGLRISEALALTVKDVSLSTALIQIRETKFYKTRLVPIGPDLVNVLTRYASQRNKDHSAQPDQPFFVSRTGSAIQPWAPDLIFSRLRRHAKVERHDGGRFQPRLHDMRHSFAVHRLISWYRQGADVQRLLPQLATYLGHVDVAATQRYLTMTPELLREASQRFERYAWEAAHA
ncbi:MAG: tyrosine-type recombinase/integrase [Candidatus Sulfotelmatobacter sp.]